MAKKRGRPRASKRRDAVVKLDVTIVGKAQMVAKAQGTSLAEYLSEMIRGPVDRDFLRVMKRIEAESAEPREDRPERLDDPPRS
jgi:hypothetical protein